MSKKPEEKRERCAEEQTRDNGEIKGGVFATMDDVAGKFSQAKREFGTEVEKSADEDKEYAKEEENTAEFAEGVHGKEFRRNEVQK